MRSKVMGEGSELEVATWVRQLEEEIGITPLWEVLFQLNAYPIPQVCRACSLGMATCR
jgi:hypothetical protein